NINNFYASIDILINGGKEAEAFGISIAEALGSSKPVMAYKLGGPIEMIDEKNNGWLINNPTLDEYEIAFKKTDISKEKLIELGKASFQRSKSFSAEKNVLKFMNIIRVNND